MKEGESSMSSSIRRQQTRRQNGGSTNLVLTSALLLGLASHVQAGWGSSSGSYGDQTMYGNTFENDWMYESSSLSFHVEGCAWGYVEDSEEAGCLEDESEEGTTNWYMMANCRRPQVVFSVYAGSSCTSGNFVGSYVTKSGVAEFVYYLKTYDANYKYGGDDDSYAFDDLPNCEGGDYGYVGLACSDGAFALNYFNDQYCISRTGNTYDSLSNLNSVISNYKSCTTTSDNGNGNLVQQLVYYSEPCMNNDYGYCSDSQEYSQRATKSGFSNVKTNKWSSRAAFGAHKSWVTKLKYVIGGLFLLASFIMFTGILFTNRRRRRAMMMRKYRQAKRDKRSSKKSGRSRSRKRSKSKSKEASGRAEGVFT